MAGRSGFRRTRPWSSARRSERRSTSRWPGWRLFPGLGELRDVPLPVQLPDPVDALVLEPCRAFRELQLVRHDRQRVRLGPRSGDLQTDIDILELPALQRPLHAAPVEGL